MRKTDKTIIEAVEEAIKGSSYDAKISIICTITKEGLKMKEINTIELTDRGE